jgi:putative ABC transport system permease protein
MRRRHLPRGIYVALGLLTMCAVFAATAGVREALVTRTQALRQVLAAATPLSKTITASANWNAVSTALENASLGSVHVSNLTAGQVTEISGQLHADFDHGAVSLTPASTDWESLTTGANLVQSALPAVGSTEVRLELTERQPLSQHMRLVAGHFPAAPPAPSVSKSRSPLRFFPNGNPRFYPLMQVVVTKQTAATFGLRVGSKVKVTSPLSLAANGGLVTFQVSGIVVPVDADASFWAADSAPLLPTLENPASISPPPVWVGGVIAGPAEADAVQTDFGQAGLAMQWGFPLALGSVTAQQAQPLSDALTSLSAQTPRLSGDVAPVAPTLGVSSGLLPTLAAYFATAQSVDALLWLLWVSLTVTGVAVLLLTARMVAMRRAAEFAVVRARGASLRQLSLAAGRTAAAVCVPAAVIGAALGLLAARGPGVPAAASAGGWWPPAAILAVAICGPVVITARQHRLPRRRPGPAAGGRGQPRARVRLVTEVTLVAAAVAGIVVFRQQATTPGGGVNLYTSAAPVLVAVPAVIVVMRVYPFVLRGLLRVFARSPGATAFLGLARATRSALTPALPAFALVLALTVAAFAGMVRDAVTNGDVAASWKAAGADVTISGLPGFPDFTVPPAAARAIAAVPGVTHEAQAWPAGWVSAVGTQLTVIAVDPASYAALVAAADGYPRFRAGLLAAPGTPRAAQPVLASPQAAAALGSGTTSIGTLGALRPVTIRVAGTVSATPAWPAGGMFVIMPFAALHSTATPPVPASVTELLLTGPGIDRARLAAVMKDDLPPGGGAIFRSDVLSGLAGAPLQHGAFTLLTISVGLAAILGIAVMFLELALGAADREATLARLATMGLGERQRARVVAVEVLPAVLAAALAAWACALVLPRVVSPAIDLSVFTSSPVPVPLAPGVSFSATAPLVPDVASLALPLGGLVVLAGIGLWIEIRIGRRRRVTAALRVGG